MTGLCRLKVHSHISVRFASTLGDHYTVNVNEEVLRQLLCRLPGGTLRPDPDYQRGTRIIVELPWREPKYGLQ